MKTSLNIHHATMRTALLSLTAIIALYLIYNSPLNGSGNGYIEKLVNKRGSAEQTVIKNIKAEKLPYLNNAISISWNITKKINGKLAIGRSNLVIDTKDKAQMASTISIQSPGKIQKKHYYIDRGVKPGSYYYVILESNKIISKEFSLIKDVNYTSKAVIIVPEESSDVRSISVRKDQKNNVVISWDHDSPDSATFSIYRGKEILDNPNKLKEAKKISTITGSTVYTDNTLEKPGIYYYAVTITDETGEENLSLLPDQNFTLNAIEISGTVNIDKPKSYKIESIKAELKDKGILIKWSFSGNSGNKYFKLYSSSKFPGKIEEINDSQIVSRVEITAGEFFYKSPPVGEYFIGIAPVANDTESPYKIKSGENITKVTLPDTKKQLPVSSKKKPKKKKVIKEKKIDLIINRTFFRGRYRKALNEMENIIKSSEDEHDIAKAKLFSARSLINLKNYKRAYLFIIQDDVKKRFPDEAEFWTEYILLRIK